MATTDGPFPFMSGTRTIGSGARRVEIPARLVDIDFKPSMTYRRGGQWPASIAAGRLAFEGTLAGEFDPLGGLRDWRCPGCGTPWVEVEPGHSWSSARGGCWTETRPIDGYGRLIEEAADA